MMTRVLLQPRRGVMLVKDGGHWSVGETYIPPLRGWVSFRRATIDIAPLRGSASSGLLLG